MYTPTQTNRDNFDYFFTQQKQNLLIEGKDVMPKSGNILVSACMA